MINKKNLMQTKLNEMIKLKRQNFLIALISIIALFGVTINSVFMMLDNYKPEVNVENPHNLWYPKSLLTGLWLSFSTFTIISNTLIAIVFAYYFIIQKQKKHLVARTPVNLALTIYIIITMIIFFVALFPDEIKKLPNYNWRSKCLFGNTFSIHLVVPILVIFFYLSTLSNKKWSRKKALFKLYPLIISVMLIYLAYALIKGTYVGQWKLPKDNLKPKIIDYSYPYKFLDIHNNLALFIGYFFIILAIFTFLFITLVYYNNAKYKKMKLEMK